MRTLVLLTAALAAALGAAVVAWRRDPRIGSAFVNAVVNPWLLQRGLAGGRHSEIAPLEHIGRRSGIRRVALLHPEPTADGFRFMVPLGSQSQWARNVVAAGHCRIQLHGQVYELAAPRLIPASQASHLPALVRRIMAALGFEYLIVRTVGVKPGALEP